MMRLSIAALVLALCVTLAAQSQRPSPSGRESKSGPPEAQTQTEQPKPAPDVRGTSAAPLIVEVQQAPVTAEQARQSQADRDDEAAARWWTVWLTGGLFLIGLITGCFVAWQAWETRKSADAAKASAGAVKVIHQQWIAISDWKAQATEHTAYPRVELGVGIKLTNTSPLPMVIRAVRATVAGSRTYQWHSRDLGPGETMFAGAQKTFHGDEIEKFKKAPMIYVIGWIHFYDAFGDEREQPFGKALVFGEDGRIPRHIISVPWFKMKITELAAQWPFDASEEHTQHQPKADKKT